MPYHRRINEERKKNLTNSKTARAFLVLELLILKIDILLNWIPKLLTKIMATKNRIDWSLIQHYAYFI